VLADALEDAGYADEGILQHCRAGNTPGAAGLWIWPWGKGERARVGGGSGQAGRVAWGQ
jgi:hypothetical protein